jgi:hypothetical protein
MTKSSPVKTLNVTTKHNRTVELDGLILPEFSRSQRIDSNQDKNTNVILGNDFLQAIRINCNGKLHCLNFQTNSTQASPSTACLLASKTTALHQQRTLLHSNKNHDQA